MFVYSLLLLDVIYFSESEWVFGVLYIFLRCSVFGDQYQCSQFHVSKITCYLLSAMWRLKITCVLLQCRRLDVKGLHWTEWRREYIVWEWLNTAVLYLVVTVLQYHLAWQHWRWFPVCWLKEFRLLHLVRAVIVNAIFLSWITSQH